jgi:hypothetical protein
MKTYITMAVITIAVVLLANCHSAKKAQNTENGCCSKSYV